jgi:CCR4-NOT complex subunit CAF16
MHAIEINALNFDFGGPQILQNVNFQLERGARCLLVGANGAGKSTLLRIIAGKHLVKANVTALGKKTFDEGSVGITYLGTEWAHNPIVRRDVEVSRLLKTLGAERYPDRCKELIEIMDINPDWHMHQISDGQRRRVQIVLGLLQPWDLLLLDEVTVDLDVLVRSDLLNFLKKETEERQATILYATHIFDGLGGWPTHIAHMVAGRVEQLRALKDGFPEIEEAKRKARSDDELTHNSPLLIVVEQWLRKDLQETKLAARYNDKGALMTKWDVLSENMRAFGDKYYNYWTSS